MDLSIITVTWNSATHIAEQIRSVMAAAQSLSFEQIVVDNASTDNTVFLIQQEFPSVVVIANKENKGFAAANNVAASQTKGKFLLFLNPDMRLQPGSLQTMVKWMENYKDVGIASCELLKEDGAVNLEATPRRFPTLRDQVALILKIHHLFPKVMDRYLMRDFDPTKEQEVDSLRGSFMLMRHEVVEKLGFAFDPRYFIWFEDVDICREAKPLGLKVVYTPIISAVDYIGQSFKKRDTVWKQKQFTKSMVQYFQKWEPWYVWMWIWLARPIGIFLVRVSNSFHRSKI